MRKLIANVDVNESVTVLLQHATTTKTKQQQQHELF